MYQVFLKSLQLLFTIFLWKIVNCSQDYGFFCLITSYLIHLFLNVPFLCVISSLLLFQRTFNNFYKYKDLQNEPFSNEILGRSAVKTFSHIDDTCIIFALT